MDWTRFAAAFLVFFATHSVPLRPSIKPALIGYLGKRGFGLAYSALSIAVLVWLIVEAGRAPYVPLWPVASFAMWGVVVSLLIGCVILAFTLFHPNPLSFGGTHADKFDPLRPGIVGFNRHPLLLVLTLWSGSHLLANGDLAHVILFGVFAAFSLAGRGLVDRRKKREMGPSWDKTLAALGSRKRFWASTMSHAEIALRLALGCFTFLALLWAHPFVIGVSPLP